MIQSRLRLISHSQRGDTIMEVLICIAVLGFILGAAFTLVSRSQTANLQAQERGVANNLVDKQVELLRAYVDAYSSLPANDYFCISFKTVAGVDYTVNDINPVLEPTILTDVTKLPAACHPDPFYGVIVYSPSKAKSDLGAADNAYGIIIRWDSASGHGKDEVKTFYKITPNVDVDFDGVAAGGP